MGRPRKVEVPGSTTGADTTTETSALSDTTGTPVPPAGDAAITAPEGADDSGAALEIITRFEAYAFADEHGHSLTNCLDFIDLVKQATTQPAATKPVITEDGQRTPHKAPVLTEHGWHVPG